MLRASLVFSVLYRWSFRSPYLFYLLTAGRRGCLFSLDHTQSHTTVSRNPLYEGSVRRRDLYLTTQKLYKTNIHASCEIRTHDPSKRLAADLSLRPRSHGDRPFIAVTRPTKLGKWFRNKPHSTAGSPLLTAGTMRIRKTKRMKESQRESCDSKAQDLMT
jgi:hypothetical protein